VIAKHKDSALDSHYLSIQKREINRPAADMIFICYIVLLKLEKSNIDFELRDWH
jgi:hypothetical protein